MLRANDQCRPLPHQGRPPQARGVLEDGTFTGYGSVFNVEDGGGDIVMPGAFAKSLAAHRQRGTSVKLLWQHDPGEPIGVWTDLREDSHGLVCTGKVFTDFDRGRQALSLMRAGAIDGLSIGYECKVWEMQAGEGEAHAPGPAGYPGLPTGGTRRLMEIDLWEVSVVTFPMNQDSRISTVRQRPAPAAPRDMDGALAGLMGAVITRGRALRSRWAP